MLRISEILVRTLKFAMKSLKDLLTNRQNTWQRKDSQPDQKLKPFNKQTIKQTIKQTSKQTNEQASNWANERMNQRANKSMNPWIMLLSIIVAGRKEKRQKIGLPTRHKSAWRRCRWRSASSRRMSSKRCSSTRTRLFLTLADSSATKSPRPISDNVNSFNLTSYSLLICIYLFLSLSLSPFVT